MYLFNSEIGSWSNMKRCFFEYIIGVLEFVRLNVFVK